MKPSAHLHLIIKATINNPPLSTDIDQVNEIMSGLVKHIRMRELSEPQTKWCDEPGNVGITSLCLLTTSHTVFHIWNNQYPEKSMFQFDIYSCAPYTVDEVLTYLKSHFDLDEISYKFLDRETGLKEIQSNY
jgi:S-adenosylmethionine/arginine decarboxylase-like enzyme